jgi:hypothetical protein
MKAFFINQGEQLEVEDTSEMFKILKRSGNRRLNEDGSEYVEPSEQLNEVEPAGVITSPDAGEKTAKKASTGSKPKAKTPAPKKPASKPTPAKELEIEVAEKDGAIETTVEETPAQ